MVVSRYQAFDWACQAADVANRFYSVAHRLSSHPSNPLARSLLGKTLSASFELAQRATKRYEKIAYGFDEVRIGNEIVPIREEVVVNKPFGNLLRFRREGIEGQPKILVVAALSGHYATLCKGTVEPFLADYDVYITDWKNARDVPASAGRWGVDEYIDYLLEFIRTLGPNTHVMGLCQSVPLVMATVAVMSQDNDPCTPPSITLSGGPVDTRINPGVVNEMAGDVDIDWFRRTMISSVPGGYEGEGRRVYPGFFQLGAFLALNPKLHLGKHASFFKNIVLSKEPDAEAHREFYDEYFSVLDATEEFYLETLEKVFLNHEIPKGKFTYRGQLLDFSSVKDTAVMTVEGANDAMCTLGQTEAAHAVFSALPESKREHYVQEEVGHYGVFSGSRFRKGIVPRVINFMARHRRPA